MEIFVLLSIIVLFIGIAIAISNGNYLDEMYDKVQLIMPIIVSSVLIGLGITGLEIVLQYECQEYKLQEIYSFMKNLGFASWITIIIILITAIIKRKK